jgi:putative hemolysin
VDRPFNTTDVCLVMDVARIDDRTRALYGAGPTPDVA